MILCEELTGGGEVTLVGERWRRWHQVASAIATAGVDKVGGGLRDLRHASAAGAGAGAGAGISDH